MRKVFLSRQNCSICFFVAVLGIGSALTIPQALADSQPASGEQALSSLELPAAHLAWGQTQDRSHLAPILADPCVVRCGAGSRTACPLHGLLALALASTQAQSKL